jgi:hypothetical protein
MVIEEKKLYRCYRCKNLFPREDLNELKTRQFHGLSGFCKNAENCKPTPKKRYSK